MTPQNPNCHTRTYNGEDLLPIIALFDLTLLGYDGLLLYQEKPSVSCC
jgi:hypothetical protein